MVTNQDKAEASKKYDSSSIKVLEGIEQIRNNFDLLEIASSIKKQGDILILSNELKVDYGSLKRAREEGRILSFFPDIEKSKANPLSRLKTDRDLMMFSKKYDVKNTSVRELYKMVKIWNNEVELDPLLLLGEEENDLILGSLLGDSSVRKRQRDCCFRFSHSLNQKDYAKWKANKLGNFDFSEFREVSRRINERVTNFIDFSTKTHPVFNYYRDLFYGSGKKKVTQNILDKLKARSLAIWICDDGSYSVKQGYIILCTYSFSLEEHKLMKEFFNNKFGLNPTIGFRDEKYYYLRFKQGDSKKLIEIIRPHIPNCMLYKIGGKING